MKRFLFIVVLLAAVFVPECMLALTGSWRGTLEIGVMKLPVVFNFKETPDGKLSATMDSPQQNAKNIPLDVVYNSTDSISLECRMIGASYSARTGSGMISGTFTQNGYRFPLSLTPEADIYSRRPQTPRAPFPYIEKDTVFPSADGVILAGTICIPDNRDRGKAPVVVMVSGSGPQNRDEELFGHRPFAVIADYLARGGVATFRYDDRGTAHSGGDFQSSTIDTFKADASAALHFIRSFPEFGKAGILGHSEGGTIALLLAPDDKPDFVISLAGVGVPAIEILLAQNARNLDKLGLGQKEKEASVRLIELVFDAVRKQYKSGQALPIDIDAIVSEYKLDVPAVVTESLRRNMQTRNGYFDSLVSLDPVEAMKRIECPVLAINGMKDVQVDAKTNLESFRRNVNNVEIAGMDGLNHLMQHAASGEISEYSEITETMSPDVLSLILDFIRRK